jgi:hypothetical protein
LSLEPPALVGELELVPVLAPAVEAAVAAPDAPLEEPAAAAAEVEPADVEPAEEPDCVATA